MSSSLAEVSSWPIADVSIQHRLWQDCADVQAFLNLCLTVLFPWFRSFRHTIWRKGEKLCYKVHVHLTLVLLNPDIPCFSVDPDQLASEEANWSGSTLLSLSMWVYINNLVQVIWLAENKKWSGHLNLFSMTRVEDICAVQKKIDSIK